MNAAPKGKPFQFSVQMSLRTFELNVSTTLSKRVTGIFGPSGSGKTSLIESIVGLRSGVRGHIQFGDTVWLDSDHHRNVKLQDRNVGYVPQKHYLFPHMNVLKNLRYGQDRANKRGIVGDTLERAVIETLELESLLEHTVAQLSGGERQRVSLGRALCSGPELLLLDEPLASLDIRLRKRILPFLLKVRDQFELPIIIVSHQPMELMTLCDEVLVLKKGELIAQDTALATFTDKLVYPAIAGSGFTNILDGTIRSVGSHTSQVSIGLEADPQMGIVIGKDYKVGESVKLSFAPTDVLLSRNAIAGISARNQWLAEVASIEMVGDHVILICRLNKSGGQQVVLELTEDAFEELKVLKGSDVYLILKSSSIEVI